MSEDRIIEYIDNPDFNDWVDTNDGNSVYIEGYTFNPSQTLYKMNYRQYCEALQLYLADDSLLLEEVYSSFPTPIAFYLYQAQENYDNPHHRLDLLKSTWEALVFFLYGIVIGEARHRKIPLNEIGVNLKEYYSDRLAQKLTIIENIIDLCHKKNYTLVCSQILSIEAISQLRKLNQKRNSFEHSFAATPERQRDLYNELLPEMITALKLLRSLDKISLFRYHSTDDGGVLLPRCDIFRGHSLDGAKKTIRLTKEDFDIVLPYFNPQSIFAYIEDETIFCLSPFIHFKRDAEDSHPKLIVFKKKNSANKYLYGIIGQFASVELDKDIFKDRDEELRLLVLPGAA